MKKKPEIIVALDVPDINAVKQLLKILPGNIKWFKIGLELFVKEGMIPVQLLLNNRKKVFLDLKLHDIPRTVAAAGKLVESSGVSMLTVHSAGGSNMIKKTRDSLKNHNVKVIAVTTLTSLEQKDLKQLGIERNIKQQVLALTAMSLEAGADGIVCSAQEAEQIRKQFGTSPILITPGIRPYGSAANDQKRITTPAEAVNAGSDFLVIGRPIIASSNPRNAAQKIISEVDNAHFDPL
jgi:orotidine-5'-phosphate decarboxylase